METDKLPASSIREWVLFGAEIGLSVLSLYIVFRAIAGPDSTRLMRARFLKASESFCQREAEGWAHMADRCARVYEKSRSVNA